MPPTIDHRVPALAARDREKAVEVLSSQPGAAAADAERGCPTTRE